MKTTFLSLLVMLGALAGRAQQKDANVAIAHKIFEAFNAHDWQKMISYYSADAAFEDPILEKTESDRRIMVQHHIAMHKQFPDIHDTIKTIYNAGESVIVEFVATGTSVNGEKFSLPICTVLTFKNGKVVRDATYYDNQP